MANFLEEERAQGRCSREVVSKLADVCFDKQRRDSSIMPLDRYETACLSHVRAAVPETGLMGRRRSRRRRVRSFAATADAVRVERISTTIAEARRFHRRARAVMPSTSSKPNHRVPNVTTNVTSAS